MFPTWAITGSKTLQLSLALPMCSNQKWSFEKLGKKQKKVASLTERF